MLLVVVGGGNGYYGGGAWLIGLRICVADIAVQACLARALDLKSCLLYELYLYFLNTYMLWNISLCHIVHLYK